MKQFTWDFNTAVGDTIKEKYETLMFKLHEIKVAMGDIKMMIGSPELLCIFETATRDFRPAYVRMTWLTYCGTMNDRIDIYKSELAPINELLLFFDMDGEDQEMATLKIVNFIQ